jgi:hypothetical protein
MPRGTMKKTAKKTLKLNKESFRKLNEGELLQIAGGASWVNNSCSETFISCA